LVGATLSETKVNEIEVRVHIEESRQLRRRIRQSIVRWPFQSMPLDDLCRGAAEIGFEGVDVLMPDEYEVPGRFGLRCTMAFAGLGDNKAQGLNRLEYHADFEAALRQNAPRAARAGITNVITFSGPRATDLNDEQGARNTVAGLKRLAPIAAEYGLTICLEYQNSKRDHPAYMCDNTPWGIRVAQETDSPNVRLLYDIYHMQIMEGDVIQTITTNAAWFHHYHLAGVPGRHEPDETQEVNWPAVMRAIAATGYSGYVAHEFMPTRDPLTSLAEAYWLCDV
jgi:hydroxypyruvate isomerase